ncbi:MAG: fructose 1,6-bisphosphatase [Thaumarchaeota archaeon]|nr:fructose 1,6-bisphosphatase [Nitrososphaerota archaeon]
MEVIEILREVSNQVYENVKNLAGTKAAAGDFGRGAGGDISRNIDLVAEKTVLDYLKQINFNCVVLGEECGRVEINDKPKGFVIMDAIDGTANAINGIPFFCCSLAFATDDKLSSITDAVVTNLSNGEQYWASKGKGAFLNETKIHVQNEETAYKIVGVNTSGASSELLKKLQPIFEHHGPTRHFGANALEMAFLSRGLIGVLIDLRCKIRIIDMAAGYLLVKEAGGLIVDANKQPLDSDLGHLIRLSYIVAANRGILDEIMSEINKQ